MAQGSSPALLIAGFGASDSLQITLEAHQAAAQVGEVLALGLQGRPRALLERQGIEISDLDAHFTGRPFAEAYAAVAATVLQRAEHDPPAMFLSQGSPLLLNAINRYLLVRAGERELPVHVYPGVSVIDMVISELGIDVGRVGLQTISARGLVARPAALNPNVPLLVLQAAGAAGTGEGADSWRALGGLLTITYPPSQAVTLLNTRNTGTLSRLTVQLDGFEELFARSDSSSSLFIDIATGPPQGRKS